MDYLELAQAENEIYSIIIMCLQKRQIPAPIGRLVVASALAKITESAMYMVAEQGREAKKDATEHTENPSVPD